MPRRGTPSRNNLFRRIIYNYELWPGFCDAISGHGTCTPTLVAVYERIAAELHVPFPNSFQKINYKIIRPLYDPLTTGLTSSFINVSKYQDIAALILIHVYLLAIIFLHF